MNSPVVASVARVSVGALVLSTLFSAEVGAADSSATVEFNRDVRPIFSDKCFTCHGPDVNNRKTPLRFDSEKGATQDLGGHFAIVAGQPEKSTLVERITSDDAIRRMPPSYEGHEKLSESDIDIIRVGSSREPSGNGTGRSSTRRVLARRTSALPTGPGTPSTTSFLPGSNARGSRPRPKPSARR